MDGAWPGPPLAAVPAGESLSPLAAKIKLHPMRFLRPGGDMPKFSLKFIPASSVNTIKYEERPPRK